MPSLHEAKGRPTTTDSRKRKARFLILMAEGHDAVAARKLAGINADRALKIVTESDYLDALRAIREGAGPIMAVVEAPTQRAA